MRRCMSCMSAIREDGMCKHCGYDNNNVEPLKKRHLIPGTILKNRFLIGLSIKSNNVFTTYIAYDIEKKKRIYIDEILPAKITKRAVNKNNVIVKEEYIARFEKAKRLVANQAKILLKSYSDKLDLLGAFGENNTFYIIRDYLIDKSIVQYMQDNQKSSFKFARHIAISLVKIMGPIHKEGIINANICPENIVVDAINSVKVTNFGFGGLNEILSVPVNDGYSPVEQYKKGELTPKADVYAIAAVYYAIVAKEKPVSAIERKQSDTLVPLSTIGMPIKRSVENAVLNALNINPQNRTQSVGAFYKELNDENTKRHWERVKSAPKRDYGFVKEKDFWYKAVIVMIILAMLFSSVGLMFETAGVKKKVAQDEQNEQYTTTETTENITFDEIQD